MRRIAFALISLLSAPVCAQEFTIATLNTESDSDTEPARVAEVIRDTGGVDIWALQEVADRDSAIEYDRAAEETRDGKKFRYIISQSGKGHGQRGNDYLAIVYNASDFREVETVELHGIRSIPAEGRLGEPDWHLRGALLVRLQHKPTGIEFYFGNVHLKCCRANDDERRHGPNIRAHQARILSHWVERADVPVVLTGDFNIPVKPSSIDGNSSSAAFNTLTESLQWHRPSNPVQTQCSHIFNSMLDHVFSTEGGRLSVVAVEIQDTEPGYCDLDKHGFPDHRAVTAAIHLRP